MKNIEKVLHFDIMHHILQFINGLTLIANAAKVSRTFNAIISQIIKQKIKWSLSISHNKGIYIWDGYKRHTIGTTKNNGSIIFQNKLLYLWNFLDLNLVNRHTPFFSTLCSCNNLQNATQLQMSSTVQTIVVFFANYLQSLRNQSTFSNISKLQKVSLSYMNEVTKFFFR